ncbi:TetR/AcrR family transcriptional regulator [Acidisoma cellulosilytica]|uniref:TetR/AcrR family transcriptional regulator n=1 Tax=Acidisoma cellulosilyticum TaxID=2802395 RepID=A0A964E558_9PROT|nr:TetR/AcrR family transcriptional regulator [Acidisoma cellulosilyticum]MCB8882164.1 TetR/AcrR family transcriptional regulator [Acidisoma cellulosilyticum]
MGRSQAAKAETHDRIVRIASERLRTHGLDGVSVADLMKEAGLTVGGFYKHFATREDLVAEAVAFGQGTWQARIAQAPSEAEKPKIGEMIDRYLSPAHRDTPAAGCLAAALVAEIARGGQQTRTSFTGGLTKSFDLLVERLQAAGNTGDDAALRAKAITVYSALIGAVGLARAVDDPALSEEIMASAAAQIKALAAP